MSDSRSPSIVVHPIIGQIIDRDCHVSMSVRSVIRHVISRLRRGHETFRSMDKSERRRFIDQCIARHRTNQRIYVEVMYPNYKPIERR